MAVFLTQEDIKKIKGFTQIGGSPDTFYSFRPYDTQEEREPKGFLMKALDYYSRTNYAVASFVNSLFVEKEGLGEAMSDAWKGLKGEQRMFFSDVLENAGVRNKYIRAIVGWALDAFLDPLNWLTIGVGQGTKLGLTTLSKQGRLLLQTRLKKDLPRYTAKFLKEVGEKKLAQTMAREAIEAEVLRTALRNPAKYVAKPALRYFGRKIPIVSNVTQPAIQKLGALKTRLVRRQPMRWIGKAFIGDEFILKHSKEFTPLQKNLLALARQQKLLREAEGYAEAEKFFFKVAKKVPRVTDRERIMRAIEKREISKLPKKLQPVAKELSDWLKKNITEPEMRLGLLRRFRGKKLEYVPHYTRERVWGRGRGLYIGITKSGQPRYFESLEALKKAGLTPIEDVAVSFSMRYAYSRNLIAFDDYVQKMVNTVGTKIDKKTFRKLLAGGKKLPEGYAIYIPRPIVRFYPLYFSKKPISKQKLIQKAINLLDELEGIRDWSKGEVLKMIHSTSVGKALKITEDLPVYLLPKEIADMLNTASPFVSRTTSDFLRFADRVTNFWKASVTSWFPAWHSRNAESNLWLCFLGGMQRPSDVKYFMQAFKLQKYGFLKRLGKEPKDFVITLGSKKFRASQLYDMAKETGVFTGWYMRELGAGYERELLKRAGGVRRGAAMLERALFEKPRAVGSAVENNARMALFLHRLAKGDDYRSASRFVKKFLFDYGELTPFEKQVMRRIIPFYCVPTDAEILTKDGWKKYNEVVIGEEVLTYDYKTKKLVWQPLQDKAVFEYNGQLMRLGNTRMEFLATFDHRWVVNDGKREKIVRGYQLRSNHKIPLTGDYQPNESILTPREAAILGWIVTDGYFRWRGNYFEAVIYQHPKKYAKEIRKLLGTDCSSEFVHPDSGVICFRIKASALKNIKKYLRSKDDLMSIVTRLNKEAMAEMRRAMLMAEGGISGRKKDCLFFTQEDNNVRDAFQFLSQMLGEPIILKKRGGYVKKRRYMKVFGAIGVEWYSGKIWCPKTPNGTWVMRRNGAVIITGNTWLRKNIPLQLEQMVKQPGKFAQIKKMQHAVESLSPAPDERYLPDWMQEKELFVRVPYYKEGSPLYINPDLAFQDLAYLNLKDPDVIRSWFANLHPAIKIPFETLTNYSLFRGRNVVDPDLPGDIEFREALKEELLDSLRIWGYKERLSREDVATLHKIIDIVLGIKAYPYDEIKSRYWYFQRKRREENALRRYYEKKAKEKLKKKKPLILPYEGL